MAEQQLPFPLRGLHRSFAYVAQPPTTSPNALNVRPDGNIEQRARGGSRPGLQRAYAQQIGSAGNRNVRMAAQARTAPITGNKTWESSEFPGDPPYEGWETYLADDVASVDGQPEKFSDAGVETLIDPDEDTTTVRNLVRSELFDVDTSEDYEVECMVYSSVEDLSLGIPIGKIFRGILRISMGMSNTTPDDGNSCYVNVFFLNTGDLNNVQNVLQVDVYSGGVLQQSTPVSVDNGHESVFRVMARISGGNLECFIDGVSQGAPVAVTTVGGRWGISVNSFDEDNPLKLMQQIRFTYVSNIGSVPNRNFPVFSAYDAALASPGGGIWQEDNPGTALERIDIDPYNLGPDVNLQATQRSGMLYIADTGTKADRGGQWDAVEDGKTFNVIGGPDLVVLGVELWDCVVIEDDSPDGLVKRGTYRINAIQNGAATNDQIVLEETGDPNIPFTDGGGGFPASGTTFDFRIERPPKVYNPATKSMTHLEADVDTDNFYGLGADFVKGPVPCGFPLVALYRDRIVLARDPLSPNIWVMSRQGDPNDWFVGGEDGDSGRPISSDNSFAGIIGEPITALMTFTDDYLCFGCTNSLWVLRGDPAEAGQIDNISDTVGVVGANSWTRTPEGGLWFLSRDGLYTMTAGLGEPEPKSRDRLPRELLNISRDVDEVFLEYDVNEKGIHVMVVPRDGQTIRMCWWYDLGTDSWWPVQYPGNMYPNSTADYEADTSSRSAVLFGGRDGYVRRHVFGSTMDDVSDYESFVVLGPMMMGEGPSFEGILRSLSIRLADNSSVCRWELYTGRTAQNAVQNSTSGISFASGIVRGGLNPMIRRRMRGLYWCLRITGTQQWIYELSSADVISVGRERFRGTVQN